nr:SDR family oxidoreductase [Aquibacillus albus]
MNIFLTGSTGFLGGKLMKNLLKDTNHHLFVLARNRQKASELKSTFTSTEQNRIHLLIGDITRPNCGLQAEQIKDLEGNVDCFYHSAALVKFDQHLRDELFAINYDGTKNALELARVMDVQKFYYVSTAYTVGQRSKGVEQLYSPAVSYNNPYEESKVKSEHLVFSYKNEMEVSIFRPSIIVGDSNTGEADSQFTLYGFMRALDVFKRKILRKETTLNTTYRIIANRAGTSNFVPVDYVAEVLSLALLNAEKNKIYHITNPKPPSNWELINMFKQALSFDRLSIVENFENYKLSAEEEKLNRMVDVFKVYLATNIEFEDHNTQKLIHNTQVTHLNMSNDTIQMIINAYFKTNQNLWGV